MKTLGPKARKPRADALRNRDKLIAAARQCFAETGEATTLEDVVARSGLGIGTLYRHFPHREALIEAVYRDEHEKLARRAETLAESLPPIAALRQWLQDFVEWLGAKRGLMTSLERLFSANPEMKSATRDLMAEALGRLLARAEAAGEIKLDIDPVDILRALVGIGLGGSGPNWRKSAHKFVDLLIAGLAARA